MNVAATASRLGPRTFATLSGRCPCRGPASEVMFAPYGLSNWSIRVSCAPRLIISSKQDGRRSFTSPSSGDDTDGKQETNGPTRTEEKAPIPSSSCFPWRHSNDPLERVVAKDDRSGLQNNVRSRFVRRMLVAHELGVPWWSRLLGTWEAELADNFVWSFRASLSGLLSSKFGVALDQINDDSSGAVSIDTSSEITKSTGEEDNEIAKNLVNMALEEELRILYDSVDPSAVQIKLKVQPVAWQLESAFLIPLLTRGQVKKNPTLRGAYQAIENEFTKSGSVKKVREMGEQLAKDSSFTGERSIIAEVSIQCLESFQIRDNKSGEVIEGSECELEEVNHVVRFEMVTSKGADRGERVAGSWQIIDWDDQLEGNIWH